MYLIAITLSLCFSYFILLFLFPLFFEKRLAKINPRSFLSLALIVTLSFVGYFIAFNIQDPDLGNRFLHSFGGGFMAFFTCFLATKDSGLQVNKFQFLFLSFLIVTALGVTNEILEFFLQNYTGILFSNTINDTWLDLISNTVGISLAAIVFTPCIKEKTP